MTMAMIGGLVNSPQLACNRHTSATSCRSLCGMMTTFRPISRAISRCGSSLAFAWRAYGKVVNPFRILNTPKRNHGLVGNFHVIGTNYGVFNIRVMGLVWCSWGRSVHPPWSMQHPILLHHWAIKDDKKRWSFQAWSRNVLLLTIQHVFRSWAIHSYTRNR